MERSDASLKLVAEPDVNIADLDISCLLVVSRMQGILTPSSSSLPSDHDSTPWSICFVCTSSLVMCESSDPVCRH